MVTVQGHLISVMEDGSIISHAPNGNVWKVLFNNSYLYDSFDLRTIVNAISHIWNEDK